METMADLIEEFIARPGETVERLAAALSITGALFHGPAIYEANGDSVVAYATSSTIGSPSLFDPKLHLRSHLVLVPAEAAPDPAPQSWRDRPPLL